MAEMRPKRDEIKCTEFFWCESVATGAQNFAHETDMDCVILMVVTLGVVHETGWVCGGRVGVHGFGICGGSARQGAAHACSRFQLDWVLHRRHAGWDLPG